MLVEMHFDITTEYLTYENLNNMLEKFYLEYLPDKYVLEKILFNEAMHFCSDMPFHLRQDGIEKKAIAIYLTGIQIFNHLLDMIA